MHEEQVVATARTKDGTEFEVVRCADEWAVRVGGMILMSSSAHHSEEALAARAIERAGEANTILVGGLGLGFTLRAVLDRVSPNAQVTVAELLPSLVEWNRQYFGPLAQHPLDDPRCQVVVGDVLELIQRSRTTFDVILLDVDNGPMALSHPRNQRIYSDYGLRASRAVLSSNGVLAIWSASPSARFERSLARAGFKVQVLRESAREGERGTHVVFLAEPSEA
jgi:spermidine synthase